MLLETQEKLIFDVLKFFFMYIGAVYFLVWFNILGCIIIHHISTSISIYGTEKARRALHNVSTTSCKTLFKKSNSLTLTCLINIVHSRK